MKDELVPLLKSSFLFSLSEETICMTFGLAPVALYDLDEDVTAILEKDGDEILVVVVLSGLVENIFILSLIGGLACKVFILSPVTVVLGALEENILILSLIGEIPSSSSEELIFADKDMARFDFLSSSSSSVNELSQDINFLSSFEVSLEHSLEPLLELSLSESEISNP